MRGRERQTARWEIGVLSAGNWVHAVAWTGPLKWERAGPVRRDYRGDA